MRAAGGPTTGVGHLVRTRSIAQECERRGLAFDFIVDDPASARWLTERGTAACAASERPGWPTSQPRAVWLDGFRDWSEELARLDANECCTVLVENRLAERDAASFTLYPALHYEPDHWDLAHSERVRGGPDWVPLSREVLEARAALRDIDLLVSYGGSDPQHLSERTLSCLAGMGYGGRVRTVIGPHMQERRASIRQAGATLLDHELVDGSRGIAEHQARSRHAITALGTTLYELAWFAVPAMILANYPEDRAALEWYERRGSHIPLGIASELAPEELCKLLGSALRELDYRPPAAPLDLASGSRRIVDLLTKQIVHA